MRFQFHSRDICPACGDSAKSILGEVPYNGAVIGAIVARHYRIDPDLLADGMYSLAECSKCRTIYQVNVGDDALLAALYDEWLNAGDTGADQKLFAWLAANPRQSRDGHEIMTAAAVLKQRVTDMKTLDFGMGEGLWAKIALGLGCASYGFDLSDARMTAAEECGVRTLLYRDIAGSGFDFINTEQVMEHISDVAEVMASLSAGLRPGGLLKISVPAQGEVRAAIADITGGRTPDSQALMPAFPLEHVNAFTVDGLVRLGTRFGLRRVIPSLAQRMAFVGYRSVLSVGQARNTLKELVRPFTAYEGKHNLIVWFQAAN